MVHKCEICDKVFKLKQNLKRHFTTAHARIKQAKAFKCNICTNSFQTKQKLNIHSKTVHGSNKNYKC